MLVLTYKNIERARILSYIFILMLVGSSAYAQQFAPVGATWTYQIPKSNSLKVACAQYRAEKDTIIAGRYCTIITLYFSQEDGTWVSEGRSEIVSSTANGDIVYVYFQDNFHIIYDFTAEVGDTIVVTNETFDGFFLNGISQQRRFAYKIDSISSVPFDSDTLSMQYVSYLSPPWDSITPEWGFGDVTDMGDNVLGRIVKGVGSLNRAAMLGTSSGFSFVSFAPDYLNCYQDEDKYYQFGDIDCDALISLHTAVHQETKGQGNQEKIYPNPFTESISIAHAPSEVSQLSISDTQGQVIKAFQQDTMTNINLSNLPSGVYFLAISFRNGSIKTYRVIKK